MRLPILFLLILVIGCNEPSEPGKAEAVPVKSRHSAAFNQSIENSLKAYDKMTEAFVQWDSANIPALASDLNQKLAKIDTQEVKGEAARLATVKRELTLIEGNHNLETKRHSLNNVSDHLFQYLKSVQYDKSELFLQECPMAFNDTESGLWISGADSIRNPFLGMHHPRYKSGMLKCGDNKEKINFSGVENKKQDK